MKRVEFYSKNKFEKSVHLVGFVIRIRTVADTLYQKLPSNRLLIFTTVQRERK